MVLLCRQCAEAAFEEWKGWPEQDPVPSIPEIENGVCPNCGSTQVVKPEHIVFFNIHRGSLGLPKYFILRIYSPDSIEYQFLKKFGFPYIE